MRDVVFIGDRPDRRSGQHRADGATLVKDEAHQPGEKLGRPGSADDLAAGPECEHFGTACPGPEADQPAQTGGRSEEHTSELQSRGHLVCRLLLEKKNKSQKYLIYQMNSM